MADVVPLRKERDERPGWAPLPMSERIGKNAVRVQRERLIGLVYGPPGVGKSVALHRVVAADAARVAAAEEWRRAFEQRSTQLFLDTMDWMEGKRTAGSPDDKPLIPNKPFPNADRVRGPSVFVVTANADMKHPKAVFEEVARAMGLRRDASNARTLLARVRAFIEERPEPVLIAVDEAQNLEIPALDLLRTLWDKDDEPGESGRCGLLFVGNTEFATRWNPRDPGHKAKFTQLQSRIGLRMPIESSGDDDVAALLDHLGVGDRAARACLHHTAEKPGHLRIVVRLVNEARAIGGVTLETLRRASARVGVEL